ncbi:MAG: TPM domain-containing protein, partial [Spirochaetes bacterium]|nr:TPM domain-containing protein [Spirochaetota bacterium]
MKIRLYSALIILIICAHSVYALDAPYLSGRVNDYAGIMSEAAVNDLEKTLKDFEQKTTCQIAVLTIKSLDGENLEQYSIKVAETWKLGQKKKDNGVLLLVAQNDRQMRIEVGYGLEGSLTDFACGRIISGEIVPQFKNGDYNAG